MPKRHWKPHCQFNATRIEVGDISNLLFITEINAKDKRNWAELYSEIMTKNFQQKKLHDICFVFAKAQLSVIENKDLIKI